MTTLESRVAQLEHEVRSVRSDLSNTAALQHSQHQENGMRLTAIENTLLEIKVYFKIGRWVVNTVWALGGAVAGAFMIKWFGAK
jgi:hypothetical protein